MRGSPNIFPLFVLNTNTYISYLTWRVRIPLSWLCVLDTTLCVDDLRQVSGFHRILRFPPPDRSVVYIRVLPVSSTNKTDRHEITEILLTVTLNIIKQTNKQKASCSRHDVTVKLLTSNSHSVIIHKYTML